MFWIHYRFSNVWETVADSEQYVIEFENEFKKKKIIVNLHFYTHSLLYEKIKTDYIFNARSIL